MYITHNVDYVAEEHIINSAQQYSRALITWGNYFNHVSLLPSECLSSNQNMTLTAQFNLWEAVICFQIMPLTPAEGGTGGEPSSGVRDKSQREMVCVWNEAQSF